VPATRCLSFAGSGEDIIAHCKHLVETGCKPTTSALKLAVIRRLYEAIQWRGLRDDNPAAGVKAPRDRTARDEGVKYLPLDGLKPLLAAPEAMGHCLAESVHTGPDGRARPESVRSCWPEAR
jgi:site-specific recombinase XerD